MKLGVLSRNSALLNQTESRVSSSPLDLLSLPGSRESKGTGARVGIFSLPPSPLILSVKRLLLKTRSSMK